MRALFMRYGARIGQFGAFAAIIALFLGDFAFPKHALAQEISPVGRLITPRGPVCTGVLIGDYTVLTAAHCVVTKSGDQYFSPNLIHFSMPHDTAGPGAYAKGTTLHINPAYTLPVSTRPEVLAEDWAVLVLDKPLGRTLSPATVVTNDTLSQGHDYALSITAFGRARVSRPNVIASGCRILKRAAKTLRHNCMVQPGSSGSVLLGRRNGRLHAVAVNVAIRRGAHSYTTAALLPQKVRDLAEAAPDPTSQFRNPFRDRPKASWSR